MQKCLVYGVFDMVMLTSKGTRLDTTYTSLSATDIT